MDWYAWPNCSPADIVDLGTSNRSHGMWGVAPRAPVHIGYDRLVIQQIAMLKFGRISRHTVLLADLHARLDKGLTSEDAELRTRYYHAFFEYGCGLKARYCVGSELQQSASYTAMLYQLLPHIGLAAVRSVVPAGLRARGQHETLSLVHVVMQCLDAVALGADLVYAERSQEKVYSLLRSFPEMMTKGRIEFAYTNSSQDVKGKALAESTRASRISIHDTEEEIRQKVNVMYAPPGDASQTDQVPRLNPLLDAYRWSVFPWGDVAVQMSSSQAGQVSFSDYAAFEDAYRRGEIHPADCKDALARLLASRFAHVLSCMGSGVCAWVQTQPIPFGAGQTEGTAK